jgi:hypothetical protein
MFMMEQTGSQYTKNKTQMKKAIIFLFVLAFGSVNAQTIDSTVTSISAVKIQPIKAQFSDSLMSTHLGVRVIGDDLKTTATLYWELLMSNGSVSVNGNYTIQGQDYTDWCNNSTPCNLWPFVLVGNKYGLTFINEKK